MATFVPSTKPINPGILVLL